MNRHRRVLGSKHLTVRMKQMHAISLIVWRFGCTTELKLHHQSTVSTQSGRPSIGLLGPSRLLGATESFSSFFSRGSEPLPRGSSIDDDWIGYSHARAMSCSSKDVELSFPGKERRRRCRSSACSPACDDPSAARARSSTGRRPSLRSLLSARLYYR